jgi:hypothetical protein
MFGKIEVRSRRIRLRKPSLPARVLPVPWGSHWRPVFAFCSQAAVGRNIWEGDQRTRTSQVIASWKFCVSRYYVLHTVCKFCFVRVCRCQLYISVNTRRYEYMADPHCESSRQICSIPHPADPNRSASNYGSADVGSPKSPGGGTQRSVDDICRIGLNGVRTRRRKWS